ncbi:MAG: hypothetical protein AAF530_00105 [Pseudomonadota bacterium]
MLSDRSALTYEFRCHSAVAASKHAWFAQSGDIVLLPEPLSAEMTDYMCQVKELAPDAVKIMSASRPPTEVRPLDTGLLEDGELLQRLKRALGNSAEWELFPYHYDRTVCGLARQLGLSSMGALPSLYREAGSQIFNDKKIFRCLAASRGVPIAEGRIASSAAELSDAFDELMSITGAVIVKQNRHSGALGNIIVSRDPGVARQGATERILIGIHRSMEDIAEELWSRLGAASADVLIVEAYYPVSKVCYVEFAIRGRDHIPKFLNFGEQRMAPLFAGFQIPGEISAYHQAHLIAGASEIVNLAKDLGFQGLIDVDAIITSDGKTLFCEVNGRCGGCSHIHHMAEALLCKDYGNEHVILSRNGVEAPGFDEVLALIAGAGLHLRRGGSEGILITAEDTRRSGSIDYMIAAPSNGRAHEIENWFIAELNLLGQSVRGGVARSGRLH